MLERSGTSPHGRVPSLFVLFIWFVEKMVHYVLAFFWMVLHEKHLFLCYQSRSRHVVCGHEFEFHYVPTNFERVNALNVLGTLRIVEVKRLLRQAVDSDNQKQVSLHSIRLLVCMLFSSLLGPWSVDSVVFHFLGAFK